MDLRAFSYHSWGLTDLPNFYCTLTKIRKRFSKTLFKIYNIFSYILHFLFLFSIYSFITASIPDQFSWTQISGCQALVIEPGRESLLHSEMSHNWSESRNEYGRSNFSWNHIKWLIFSSYTLPFWWGKSSCRRDATPGTSCTWTQPLQNVKII